MWNRFTEKARQAIYNSQEEATRLQENCVSTEHILLGLLRLTDSVGVRILERVGIRADDVAAITNQRVPSGPGRLPQELELTPRAKRVIDLAYDEARRLNNNYIGTEHLLLGLVREDGGLAGMVLREVGADLEVLRSAIIALPPNSRWQWLRDALRFLRR